MARGGKDFFDLDDALESRLVFETFGDQRYTQDSPIMPDVWMGFARCPRRPPDDLIDVLLTPLSGNSASQLATLLGDRLATFANEEQHETRLRGLPLSELVPALAAPSTGVDKRAEFDVAYSRSSVVARVTFRQLIRVIVPMTEWWFRLPAIAKNFEEFREKLSGLGDGDWTVARLIAASDLIVKRSTWDFIRFCALAGFIALKRKFEEEVEAAGDQRDVILEARKRELETLMDDLTRKDTSIRKVAKVIDAYGEIAKDILDYKESLPEGTGQPRIFMVTENRKATLSVAESRGTIKADAAHNLFKIDTSDFTWAVIDGGIDAQHPAFLDKGAVARLAAQRDAKAPAATPEEYLARRQADEKMAREDIPIRSLARFSRVRETYDFTYLRRLLSLKDLPPPDEKGLSPERAQFIRANFRSQLEALRVRTVLGREIDWDTVAPLIRVWHDDNYAKPEVGHGTHVAGILGGNWLANDNPEGIDLVGICPEISLYDLRVYKPGGTDEFTVQYALQFVEHLNRNRDQPRVHGVNLSLSMNHEVMSFACGRTPVCDECNALVGTGVVVVVAAGNDGYKTFKTDKGEYSGYHTTSITDPGNAEDVITVGATHRSHPHAYGVSYFSSRGPTGDGRRKPDLVAPGEKITAPILNCSVQRMDGTSMAAPHVSGAAALLMARHRELIRNPRRIKEILCRTATDLGRESHFQGAGMVDILRALQSV
ncbi:MAG: S8 family serine peptidase [Enhydrobacter sp.]|nr:S8 family serine peptidase [Enhydrobacter sp.]